MKFKRLALIATITVLSITILTEVKADPAQPFIPAGYQSYYVLGNSTLIINHAVDIATGNNPTTSQPYSVFSLVSYQNRSRIYVDQKSNGYTFHPSNFSGADAVFELDKGGVLILDNWASPYYSIEPPGWGSLISGSLGPVDGGDYFHVAGGPVNVFRGATDRQSGTGPDGNYVAGMWELYSMEHGGEGSQMSYVVPVGEDTLRTPDFNGGTQELRGGTYLVVQSTEDGTVINYTIQGTPYTRNMSRGESFVMQHVYQSDTVESNKKVQVGLIGSGGESFDVRYFTLPDANFTGNDYWIPTFPSGYPAMNIRFHIYAITDANVTITTDSGVASGWNGKHLSASTVDPSFTTDGTTAVHIVALEGQRILILVSVDTGSGSRDWEYVPVDSLYFATSYYIPYAPSGKLNSRDMQLFVTPLFDGTTIYVDYDQDGVVDDNVTLNRYESWGFFDPADMDNTGTYLYSDFDFTVVYGETAYADSGGVNAGYDWVTPSSPSTMPTTRRL